MIKQPDDVRLEIYIARHGESLGNLSFRERNSNADIENPGDLTDPPLSELGRVQARLLGERLSPVRFDAIISSPLIRAIETAHEVSVRQPGGAVPIELLPDLMEVSTAPLFRGKPYDELKKRFPELLSYPGSPSPAGGAPYLGEEPDYQTPFDRGLRCIKYITSRFSHGERVFVSAHGTFNTCLIHSAVGLDGSSGFRFCQENTGLTKIRYYYDGLNSWGNARISFANDTSHLYSLNSELAFTL